MSGASGNQAHQFKLCLNKRWWLISKIQTGDRISYELITGELKTLDTDVVNRTSRKR